MTTYTHSPYDPNNDTEKPQVGDLIDPNKPELGTVGKVEVLRGKECMRLVLGPEPELDGFDDILVKNHSSRAAHMYIVFVKKSVVK